MNIPINASEIDTRAELAGQKLKAGNNEIQARSKSGLRLILRAVEGKELTYRVVDKDGKAVSDTFFLSATAKKATTCWQCGVDSAGNRHCWIIPCTKIVGPWNPDTKLKAF